MARLFCGEVDGVLWGLQRMQPATAEAASEIKKLIAYLDHDRDRINYRAQRKAGYPLGSGGIESANKFICHVRLKRSGPGGMWLTAIIGWPWMCQVQWDLRPGLRAVSAENA